MSLRGKLSLMYYKYVLRRFDESSLRSKIVNDVVFNLFMLFILFFLFSFYLFNYFFGLTFWDFFKIFVYIIFLFLLFLLFMDYVIKRSLQKHIFNRFDNVKREINEIKQGDYSKRIHFEGSDEFAKLVYFTNELLMKFESQIEIEKNYSLIDSLTKCYNRRALDINFDLIKKKAKRHKDTFTVVVLDLDFFKKINDTYGHKVGDDVLVSFSNFMRLTIREEDFLYRIGGEEFVLLLSNTNKSSTRHFLSRFRKKVPYHIKKTVPEVSADVTVSGGFVLSNKYDLSDEGVLDKMISDADKLLYDAKKNGRNQIVG